jgi:hypothetical protein
VLYGFLKNILKFKPVTPLTTFALAHSALSDYVLRMEEQLMA